MTERLTAIFVMNYLQAVRSFSCAVHFNPADEELWKEDLLWAADLLRKKQLMQEALLTSENLGKAHIEELDSEEEYCTDVVPKAKQAAENSSKDSISKSSHDTLPVNYIKMRDIV